MASLRLEHEKEAAARMLDTEQYSEEQPQKHRTVTSKMTLILLATNFCWATLLLVVLVSNSGTPSSTRGTLPSTDFVSDPVIRKVPLSVQFDDILRYNSTSHELWRDIDPSLPQYFGEPSPEIDFAWARLLLGEFPGVSPAEIQQNKGLQFDEQDRYPQTGQFHVALDVFHSLHCLNAARKELDKAYYSSSVSGGHRSWSDKSQRVHIDHCLNHIRQSLQCRPDLSPAAMRKHIDAEGAVFYLGNAERHECAAWSEIRRWVDDRRASSLGAWEN